MQDTGPGIRCDARKGLERFRQAQGGTTREFSGTGLGLSIAQDFVELTAERSSFPTRQPEEPQFRSRFRSALLAVRSSEFQAIPNRFGCLPYHKHDRGRTAARPGAEPQPAQAAGNPTVLVVEDHSEMRRFIVETLSSDYRVIEAADGVEGWPRRLRKSPTWWLRTL